MQSQRVRHNWVTFTFSRELIYFQSMIFRKFYPRNFPCHKTTTIVENTIFKNSPLLLSFPDDFPKSYMANGNITRVTEFILTGVSECPDLQIPLFFVFLVIYGLTMTVSPSPVWTLGFRPPYISSSGTWQSSVLEIQLSLLLKCWSTF